MGSIFSIFRSKPGTKALLAKIQNEIESIEDYKWSAAKRQKNYLGLLLIVSVLVYIICALICYFFYFPKTSDLTQKILYLLPFLVLPLIFWALKRTLQWYYRWVIDTKDDKLRELKKQKKKILERVQETETFKEAKEILEKYDPKSLADLSFKNMDMSSTSMANNMSPQRSQTNTQLRYRGITTPQMRAIPPQMNRMSTPSAQQTNNRPFLMPQPLRAPAMTPIQTQRLAIMPSIYPQTIKPILPQQRGVMEKLVDYVVGDGPNNRYALICIHCHSHNGMALKEEFEFIAFKCCYCMRFNPPRKVRQLPPRLEPLTQTNRSSLTPVVDEPESDSDSNKGPISCDDSSKMKIEDITSDTDIESNRRQSNTEVEEESQTQNTEEIKETSIDNEITEDLQIDNESKESLNETEKSLNATNISEDINFIDEESELLSSDDKSPVLL